jgi:hypothetical protein
METVSRNLTDFENEKLIEKNHNELILLNQKKTQYPKKLKLTFYFLSQFKIVI